MEQLLNNLRQARKEKNFKEECTIVMTLELEYNLTVKEINKML